MLILRPDHPVSINNDRFVESFHTDGEGFAVEVSCRMGMPGNAKLDGFCSIAQQLLQVFCQLLAVAGLDQKSGFPLQEDLFQSAATAGNDGNPLHLGLGGKHSKWLVPD